MRTLVLFLVASFLFVCNMQKAEAQAGKTKTLTAATLDGNNNRTLAEIPVTGTYESLLIKVKADRVSTAAGGTLYLKAGMDSTSAQVINQSVNPNLVFAPNDTLTFTDVVTQYWNIVVPDPGELIYHIFGDGDADDTMTVTTSYFLKK